MDSSNKSHPMDKQIVMLKKYKSENITYKEFKRQLNAGNKDKLNYLNFFRGLQKKGDLTFQPAIDMLKYCEAIGEVKEKKLDLLDTLAKEYNGKYAGKFGGYTINALMKAKENKYVHVFAVLMSGPKVSYRNKQILALLKEKDVKYYDLVIIEIANIKKMFKSPPFDENEIANFGKKNYGITFKELLTKKQDSEYICGMERFSIYSQRYCWFAMWKNEELTKEEVINDHNTYMRKLEGKSGGDKKLTTSSMKGKSYDYLVKHSQKWIDGMIKRKDNGNDLLPEVNDFLKYYNSVKK